MKLKRTIASALTGTLLAGLLTVSSFAAQPQMALELKVSGGTAVGETMEVELWCENNPGLCAAQFTLTFDTDVLDCVDCGKGDVIRRMMGFENPDGRAGAIVAAASASPVEGDGLLASYTFEVIGEGECEFAIINTDFSTQDGEQVEFTLSGADLVLGDGSSGGSSSGSSKPSRPSGGSSSSGSDTSEDAEAPAKPVFTDIEGHWAQEYFITAKQRGLMDGYPDGRVGVEDNVTRAQFVTILWQSAGKPEPKAPATFVDVKESDYYYKPVAWAQENGYVSGMGEGKFGPDYNVSREQIAVVLRQMAGGGSQNFRMFASTYDKAFADSASVAFWSKDAVYWAVCEGIWCGRGTDKVESGTALAAHESASRAEIAVMVIRYQDKIGG